MTFFRTTFRKIQIRIFAQFRPEMGKPTPNSPEEILGQPLPIRPPETEKFARYLVLIAQIMVKNRLSKNSPLTPIFWMINEGVSRKNFRIQNFDKFDFHCILSHFFSKICQTFCKSAHSGPKMGTPPPPRGNFGQSDPPKISDGNREDGWKIVKQFWDRSDPPPAWNAMWQSKNR